MGVHGTGEVEGPKSEAQNAKSGGVLGTGYSPPTEGMFSSRPSRRSGGPL